MRGDGQTCTPINEVRKKQQKYILYFFDCYDVVSLFLFFKCEEANPCSPLAQCVDMLEGFRCTPCPDGYTGNVLTGTNLGDAMAGKQV